MAKITRMLETTVLPSGHLRCRADGAETGENSTLARVAAAFVHDGEGGGLIRLAGLRALDGLSMGAMFWRDFAERFLRAFSRRDDLPADDADGDALDAFAENAPETPPPSSPETLRILLTMPPMPGGEYLTVSALDGRWRAMDAWARGQIAENGGTAAFFLRNAPQFRDSGQICFHLAECREETRPFALLTSVAAGNGRDGRPVRVKLTAAIAEKSPKILAAIRRAADKSPFIKDLLATGRLFAPVPLNPDAAYAFLRETAVYESAGIHVQVPDWWQRKPLAQVQFSLGNSSQERFTGDALLDCDVKLTMDGKPLPPEAVGEILNGESGLRQIYGQWVEIDAPKLRQVMHHWQKVKEQEGLTFAAGMRLLAGADAADAADGDDDAAIRRWSTVTAGESLQRLLAKLRPGAPHPRPGGENPGKPLCGKALHAVLRPYQEQGVRWLYTLSRLGLGACLADDMGLGKTLQTIALLVLYKRRAHKAGKTLRPSLLVAPASLLGNWRGELQKFAPGLRVRILHPAYAEAPLAQIGEQAEKYLTGVDLALTTYTQLARSSWMQHRRWHLAVLDEAQAVKNPASRQSKAVRNLRARARLALTGTPVENRLGDLWALFAFLNPQLLGNSLQFKAWTAKLQHGENGFAPLRRLIAPYILRRLKTDRAIINDLPDKTEVDVFCGLSATQARLYREQAERLARELEHADGLARRGIVLAYLMRFKQICNHPAQFSGAGFYPPEESGKFLRLREICEKIAARQEKALVFTQFREMTAPLAAFLRTVFRAEGLVLHGGTPPAERARLAAAFQNEDGPPFFVLSLKAGGTGLNLTAAAHVIHFDRWWNPAVENQATDRAYRIGQHRNVLAHKFVCTGTLEEKINRLLQDKAALSGELLGDGGEDTAPALTALSNAELLRVVSLDWHTAE